MDVKTQESKPDDIVWMGDAVTLSVDMLDDIFMQVRQHADFNPTEHGPIVVGGEFNFDSPADFKVTFNYKISKNTPMSLQTLISDLLQKAANDRIALILTGMKNPPNGVSPTSAAVIRKALSGSKARISTIDFQSPDYKGRRQH